MSDNNRKRSRKAKLEPRDCEVEVIEDDVEEIPRSSTSESVEEFSDMAEIRLLPKIRKIGCEDESTSKHNYDIDVKIEQFDFDSDDGGCLNIDEEQSSNDDKEKGESPNDTQNHDKDDYKLIIDEHNYERHYEKLNENSLKPSNDNNDEKSENNDNETENVTKSNNPCSIISGYSLQFTVNEITMSEERLKQEIEKFSQITTSAVDKQIEVLTGNLWKLQTPHIYDYIDIKLSEVFITFKHWAVQSRNRDNILMYKCYICKLAWWHFHPFKEHIRIHKQLELSTECSSAEMNVIAFNYKPCYQQLTPEGDCWQCQKSMEHFICGTYRSSVFNPYHCSYCQERFKNCALLRKHEGKCQRFLKAYFQNKSYEPSKTCEYCDMILLTKESYNKHMELRHTVRSDVYVVSERIKFHDKCNLPYISMYFHTCPAMEWNYKCDFCESRYTTSRLAMLHRDLGRPMNCLHCNQYLKKECMLLDHLLSHTQNYTWLFQCKRCPGKFFTEDLYVTVHRYHNGYPNTSIYRRLIAPAYCTSTDFAKKLNEEEKKRKENDDVSLIQDVTTAEEATDYKEFEEMELSIADALSNFKPEPDNDKNDDQNFYDTKDDDKIANDKDKQNDKIEISIDPTAVKEEVVSDDDLIAIDDDEDFQRESEALEAELSKVFKASQTITGEIVDPKSIHEEIDIKQEIKEEDDSSSYEDDIIQFSYEPKLEITYNSIDTDIAGTSIGTTYFNDDLKPRGIQETVSKVESDYMELKLNKSNIIFKPDEILQLENQVSDDDISLTSNKSETDILSEEEWDCAQPKRKHKNRKVINKIYTCIKCNFSGLHRAYRTHLRDNCEYRKQKRPSLGSKSKQNLWTLYRCSRCFSESMTITSYLYHMRMHGLPKTTCPKCGLLLPSDGALAAHVEDHIKSNFLRITMIRPEGVVTSRNDCMYECQECQLTIQFKDFFKHWEMHLEFNKVMKIDKKSSSKSMDVSKVNEDSNENMSDECELVPKDKCVYLTDNEPKKVTPLSSEMLQKVLESLQARKKPKSKRENGTLEAYMCVVCQKQFDRIHDIKVHLVQHLLGDAMAACASVYQLRCQICGRELINISTYKEHLRQHGGLPVYRCLACKKSFSDSSNFAKHKKIHNLMVLVCDICQKKFRSKDMLRRHIEEHMSSKPERCELCEKVFFTKREYTRHYRVRHVKKDQQFKCMICNVYFSRLKFKWDHMWEEHGIRKFKADCPMCNCSFRKLSSVKQHMMEVHNKNMSSKLSKAIKSTFRKHFVK